MRVLAIEPFYGGSHQAFLDGWIERSRHTWTTFTLPDRHWKWRMRHAAVTLADKLLAAWASGQRWDVLFCSDMLDLVQLLGLTRSTMSRVPSIVYFHENQLTYPQQNPNERDLHFAFTNFVTALTADGVWFNSGFHREDFLSALYHWFGRMPDHSPHEQIKDIREKSSVQSPGVETASPRRPRIPGPLRIVWAARWEHDKNADSFFDAIRLLRRSGSQFRLSVYGQSFKNSPSVFLSSREEFKTHVDHWGFVESHDAYLEKMARADVFVSTANHEFFGLAAMEAISLGLRPLLPRRLSYPELMGLNPIEDNRIEDRLPLEPQAEGEGNEDTQPLEQGIDEDRHDLGEGEKEDRLCFLYGSVGELASRLRQLAERPDEVLSEGQRAVLRKVAERYSWKRRAAEMDDALEEIVRAAGKKKQHDGQH